MFKVGDKVRRVANGQPRAPLGYETTITGHPTELTYTDCEGNEGAVLVGDQWEPVSEGPVRTVTVTTRRIVPGVYGPLHVSGRIDGKLHVSMGGMGMVGQTPLFTADELDAAARTLQQLAEALRDDMD